MILLIQAVKREEVLAQPTVFEFRSIKFFEEDRALELASIREGVPALMELIPSELISAFFPCFPQLG